MTREQLLRFVEMRNRSGFASNLAFQVDADYCGFRAEDLGEVEHDIEVGTGQDIWRWHTKWGVLEERYGQLTLHFVGEERQAS